MPLPFESLSTLPRIASSATSLLPEPRGRSVLLPEVVLQIARAVNCFTGAELVQLKNLSDFDLAFLSLGHVRGSRNSFRPFDCFLLRFDLDHPVSGNHLLCFAERTVDDPDLILGQFDERAL